MKKYLCMIVGIVALELTCALAFGCENAKNWRQYEVSEAGLNRLWSARSSEITNTDWTPQECTITNEGAQIQFLWDDGRKGVVAVNENIMIANGELRRVVLVKGMMGEDEDAENAVDNYIVGDQAVLVVRDGNYIVYANYLQNGKQVFVRGESENDVSEMVRWLSMW